MIAKRTPPKGRRQPVEPQDAPSISVNRIYTIGAFQKIVGLGSAALKSARRKGLRVRKVLGRSYVTGRDFLAFIDASTHEEVANVP